MGKRGPKGKVTPLLIKELRRVKAVHPNYGRTRVTRELRNAGFQISEKTVGNTLRRLGLQLPPKKRVIMECW